MFEVVNAVPYIANAMEIHYRTLHELSVFAHLEDRSFQKMYGLSGIIDFPYISLKCKAFLLNHKENQVEILDILVSNI